MKSAALFLAIASLALTAPVIADARPDGQRARAERIDRQDRGGRVRPDAVRPDRDFRVRPRPDGPIRERPRPDGRPGRDSLGAGWRQQQDEARRGVRSGQLMPLNRVLPNLQRRFPGRQLDAGIETGWQGQPVYRVRWAAANGRRIDFIVDARTGAILDAEGQ
jgi:peptidase YpeB-like protein